MDIKSRNSNNENFKKKKELKKINFYSKNLKIIAIVCIYIVSVLFIYNYNFLRNSTKIYNDTELQDKFSNYIYKVIDTEINLKDEKNIESFYKKKFDKDDIDEQTMIYKISERTNDFKNMKAELNKVYNFIYLIEDKQTEKKITNIYNNPNIHINTSNFNLTNPEYLYNNQSFYNIVDIFKFQEYNVSFINGSLQASDAINGVLYEYQQSSDLISQIDIDNRFNLYFAIVSPVSINLDGYGDIFYAAYNNRQNMIPIYNNYQKINIILGIILFILLFYIILVSGRNEKYGELKLRKNDNIYIEVYTIFVVIISIILSIYLFEHLYEILLMILILLIELVVISYVCSISRRFKAGIIFKTSFIKVLYYYFLDIKQILKHKSRYGLVIFLATIIILIGVNGFLYLILINDLPYFRFIVLGTIILDFCFILWIINLFISFKKLNIATFKISNGDIKYNINMDRMSIVLKPLVNDLENIQQGLLLAVDEAVKGERLKTELITNVSHDLKTPLTSIINYLDLLKKEDISNEKAKEYIAIVDEKSQRLKNLIEDLIEASKVSSGNINIMLEKLDLIQLLNQSYGEYEEKLSKNNLQIKINSLENQIYISADGKHLWRILSNVLSNVSKYALHDSRVYIDIVKDDNYGVFTIKNISANQLNISPELLTERFIRGDESRTTEGSGLGLSIAQSLTKLQNGEFNIDIDGDLFKVTIKMPLYNI